MRSASSGGCHRTASSVMNRTCCGKISRRRKERISASRKPHLSLLLEIAVGGDDRAQVLAELHVGGRAVVDGADADRQELAGDVAGFLRYRLDQGVVQRGAGKVLRIEAGDAEVAFGLALDDGGERLEHGGHQHRSERMRFERRIVDGRARRARACRQAAAARRNRTPRRRRDRRPSAARRRGRTSTARSRTHARDRSAACRARSRRATRGCRARRRPHR